MMTATTNRQYFKELQSCRLFFMRRKWDSHEDNCYFEATRKEISAMIYNENIVNRIQTDYILVVVDRKQNTNIENNDSDEELSDSVDFSYRIADPRYDWIVIINSYLLRSQNTGDKYPFIYLLWFLNHSNWNIQQLKDAISRYDIKVHPFIFNGLKNVCSCLSIQKQQQIKEVLNSFGYDYYIYQPVVINEALNYVTPTIVEARTRLDLFGLVDYIIENHYYYDTDGHIAECEIDTNSSNDFICFYKWLITNEPFKDYNLLKSIYPLVSSKCQLQIIKRYFHDVRLGNTSFDTSIVEQFRHNDFEKFIRYRYCLNTPDESIYIGSQLLCDCILTLNQTHGRTLQTFNGILDFAISHSDITNPKMNLGLVDFLPRCDGGAVYNDDFCGFIDYAVTIYLDESKLTDDYLIKSIKSILDGKGKRKHYFVCKSNRDLLLAEDSKCRKYACCISVPYEDKWIICTKEHDWYNLFLKEPILPNSSNQEQEYEISIDDVSIDRFKYFICKLITRYKQIDDGLYLVSSQEMQSSNYGFLTEYSKAKSMRIYPRKETYISMQFDAFGIKTYIEQDSIESREKECSEVTKRVVASLESLFKKKLYNEEFFELPYNQCLLDEVKRLYYYRKPGRRETIQETQTLRYFVSSKENKNRDKELAFLKKRNLVGNLAFCAPKLSHECNQATGLSFFWCRGSECFRNVLDRQILRNTGNWEEYTLFHLMEIIGYSKLREIDGVFEPDGIITEFIVVANKALKTLARLKCRSCGHLMFAVGGEKKYNQYNHYSCINPNCEENNKPVYLSYCHNCKKGLIDSRDSKQCPNGWYICPTCLSCCTDELYERQAQRYVLSHRPIPERIQTKLGLGHNDKNRYFCPTCGAELEVQEQPFIAYCKSCDKKYNNGISIHQ